MPAPSNLSFETAGSVPGLAFGWTLTASSGGVELAEFAPSPPTTSEAFERGFASNEAYLFALGTSIDGANFNTTEQAPFDTFTVDWGANGYKFALTSSEQVSFGPDTFDAFDTGWLTPLFLFELDDLTPATFDGEPKEDFEDAWTDPYALLFEIADLFAYAPLSGAALLGYEAFEPVRPTVAATVDVAANMLTAPGHAFQNGDVVTLSATVPPAPLSSGAAVYVRDMSGTTFKVALDAGGAALDLTGPASLDLTVRGNPIGYWLDVLTL
jgi:hypothetical protein